MTLYSTLAYCDTGYEHEIHILTDGHRLYAHGGLTDAGQGWQGNDNRIWLDCNQPTVNDLDADLCTGVVCVTLNDADATTDPEAIADLAKYGQDIEQ